MGTCRRRFRRAFSKSNRRFFNEIVVQPAVTKETRKYQNKNDRFNKQNQTIHMRSTLFGGFLCHHRTTNVVKLIGMAMRSIYRRFHRLYLVTTSILSEIPTERLNIPCC